jgi:hypothetical protein
VSIRRFDDNRLSPRKIDRNMIDSGKMLNLLTHQLRKSIRGAKKNREEHDGLALEQFGGPCTHPFAMGMCQSFPNTGHLVQLQVSLGTSQ